MGTTYRLRSHCTRPNLLKQGAPYFDPLQFPTMLLYTCQVE